jgi:hypothetical protein
MLLMLLLHTVLKVAALLLHPDLHGACGAAVMASVSCQHKHACMLQLHQWSGRAVRNHDPQWHAPGEALTHY